MERSVTIRPARESDLPQILTIFNDLVARSTAVWIDEPVTLDSRARLLAERQACAYPFLVAEASAPAGPVVAGYATFGAFRAYAGYRQTVEHTIHVAEAWRGRGIGKALMQPLIDTACASGKHVMVAAITADNTASIRLHEAFGFETVGLMPQVGQKFGRWLDLLLMQKIIA